MEKFSILAILEAKPGKENEVYNFLKSALPLAVGERETVKWYASQIDAATFFIFDTFESEEGRSAHLNGQIADILMARAPELLAKQPLIRTAEILAVK